MKRTAILASCTASVLMGVAMPAAAQDREVPYWATIDVEEVNMRKGPSERFPIEWVYHREGLPLKVIRVNQGWRYVEDPDGDRGWIVARFLSAERGAIVTGEGNAEIRAEPTASSALLWHVEPGVTGSLGGCEAGWCAFDVGGQSGWIEASRIWGDDSPER